MTTTTDRERERKSDSRAEEFSWSCAVCFPPFHFNAYSHSQFHSILLCTCAAFVLRIGNQWNYIVFVICCCCCCWMESAALVFVFFVVCFTFACRMQESKRVKARMREAFPAGCNQNKKRKSSNQKSNRYDKHRVCYVWMIVWYV